MALKLDRLNILLIDDNLHMRHLLRAILHGLGVVNVYEANEGSDALGLLRQTPIDIAIVDWMMEPLDGLEFTRMIRTASDSPNKFLPIIMLTGHTERHRIVEARDAGVTEFLAKPVNAAGVYSRLRAVIENPRSYVKVGRYFGPDRRRKLDDFAGIKKRAGDDTDVFDVNGD